MLKPNDRFELVSDPSVKGIIDTVLGKGPTVLYAVTYFEGRTGEGHLRHDEIRMLVKNLNPWENLKNGRFSQHSDFVLNSVLHKVQNTVDNTISTLKASKTLFKPHQFIPLIKLLKYQQGRLMIADEVGLGKTIEAGHILLELFSRKMISRVLVICTKTLRPKWVEEMREKFAFPFREVKANDLMEDFGRPTLPEDYFGVINYDVFSANKKLISFTETQKLQFDLIICDEVQALRNSATKRYKALKPVLDAAGFLVFLSATPINNSLDDLYNLLSLLDPVRYFNRTNFANDNELNRPFVKALNQLNRKHPFAEIANGLREARVLQTNSYGIYEQRLSKSLLSLLEDDPLFQRALSKLDEGIDTLENRVMLQRDLTELNSINYLFSRTKKRDVEGNTAVRRPNKLVVRYGEEEKRLAETEMAALYKDYQQADGNTGRGFGIITKERQMSSCLPAYFAEKGVNFTGEDSKYTAFSKVLDEVVKKTGNKLIVFAEYKATLRYLAQRLRNDGINAVLITGDNPQMRAEHLRMFKYEDSVQVLLSSKVGTEGIDLQFCDAMVNYDLPWNPMVLEQRIGRIDRIGQQSEVLSIYNLVVQHTIEEDIYDVLLSKIRIFEESIGVLESILADQDTSSDEFTKFDLELYAPELSPEERRKKIESRAISLIHERENISKIEAELTDAMVQDFYFRDEISKILNNERYVTSENLRQYILRLLKYAFQEINVVSNTPQFMELEVNTRVRQRLEEFVREAVRNAPVRLKSQLNQLVSDFIIHLRKPGNIRLCFDGEDAFNRTEMLHINTYHPLIYAATELFKQKQVHTNNAYSFQLQCKSVESYGIRPGYYIMAVNEFEVARSWLGNKKVQRLLVPLVMDLNGEELVSLDEETSERFYRFCQQQSISRNLSDPLPAELVDSVRVHAITELDRKRTAIENEEKIRNESARLRYIKQLSGYYEWRIEAIHSKLNRGEGIRAILESEIEKLESEYESRKAQLSDSEVFVTSKDSLVVAFEVV